MRAGLDTSVLMRLLINDPPELALRAKGWLQQCLLDGEPPIVTDAVVSEAYFALQNSYGVSKAEALRALQTVLESGKVDPIGRALNILQNTPNLANAKPGFVDRIIHAEICGLGCEVVAFDRDFARLPGTTVL